MPPYSVRSSVVRTWLSREYRVNGFLQQHGIAAPNPVMSVKIAGEPDMKSNLIPGPYRSHSMIEFCAAHTGHDDLGCPLRHDSNYLSHPRERNRRPEDDHGPLD
jgi:hypothetical protein